MVYKNNRPKAFAIIFMLLLPAVLYVSYRLSGLYLIPDLTIMNLQDNVVFLLTDYTIPVKNEKTGGVVLIGLLIWLIAFAYCYTKATLNLMHGMEHGTAKWGSVKKFNQKYKDKDEHNNKILGDRVRMSYSTSTLRNNNMFIVGGSGAGKTAFEVSPNLLNLHDSNVYTDPKGGLLKDYGNWLSSQPNTRVYSINLCEMEQSMRFNPFVFLRKRSDVPRLIRNIMQNTNPDEGTVNTADPFWDKAESLYLQSIFLYIWMECPRVESDGGLVKLERNFKTVLHLLDEAKIDDDEEESDLDIRMATLEQRNPKHPAVVTYNRFRRGAGDTMRSIIISANSRFNQFDDPDILRILSDNDIPLDEIGTGINGDGKTKSYLFVIIPDDDDTWNFIPGMIYTLMFQELYYQARIFGGKLPLDVGFWFDEFANIKMPANFDKILATCRSRGIYCVPILQSLAQIKKLFKDGAWEGIVGNCDTFIYLGGNEQSSHKYISELLGKWTIDKRTSGESKGTSGSASENYDVLGRELMDAPEVRKLPDNMAIIFVRGEDPILTKKWYPWKHQIHHEARKCGDYEFDPDKFIENAGTGIEQLNESGLKYYEKLAKKSDKIKMYDISMTSFLTYSFTNMSTLTPEEIDNITKSISERDKEEGVKIEEERAHRQERDKLLKRYDRLSLIEICASDVLEDERKEMCKKLIAAGLPEDKIKQIIHLNYSLDDANTLTNTALSMYS